MIWAFLVLGLGELLTLGVAGAALAIAYKSSPTQLLKEFTQLSGLSASAKGTADTAMQAIDALRETFTAHRATMQETLEAALDANDQAERRRRSARRERGRAEELRETGDDPAAASGMCAVCGNHPANISCMEAAKARFRAEGHAV